MKKLFLILIMGISTCITVYSIMIWKPSDNHRVKNQTNGEEIENSDINEGNISDKYGNSLENSENEIGGLSSEEDRNLDMAVQNSISNIDIKEIEYKLSKGEKEKIDRIIKGLSSVDLINIKEKFIKEDKADGFREGFNLIRRRLSNEDYEEIKLLLSDYIDFSILEVEI